MYQTSRCRPGLRRAGALALAAACALPACKRKPLGDRPEEHGRLIALAAKLEEGFASENLPPIDEPFGLAERLARYEDFRDCLVRTYVARRLELGRARAEGRTRPSDLPSIGDEAVVECAVQAAVVREDPTFCERLELDYRGPDGEVGLPGLRCRDTRARVLGLPDECPLVWTPADAFVRNPECLAMARRDDSLCFFAENPARCRALVQRDEGPCRRLDAAPDCRAAVAFWADLLPLPVGKPLFEAPALEPPDAPPGPGAPPAGLHFELRFRSDQDPRLNLKITAPRPALFLSWPARPRSAPAPAPRPRGPWRQTIVPGAADLSFLGESSVKLQFQGGGLAAATLPLGAPGPTSGAALLLVIEAPDGVRLHCQSGAQTEGQVSYRAEPPAAGGFLHGTLDARLVGCDDGSTAHVQATFRAAILDTR